MDKEKQIEEMACDMCNACDGFFTTECIEKPCWDIHTYAELLYNAGYRKASEVAREIFEEIEEALYNSVETEHFKGTWFNFSKFKQMLVELKKKYTESEKDNG